MILSSFFSRSAENPSVPISEALKDFDITTTSGEQISRHTAIKLSPLYRAVALIANDVARLPLDVYHRVKDGKERELGTNLARLLRRKANPRTTAFIWKRTTISHLMLEGNAYSYIERDAANRIRGLYILDPERVTPQIVQDEEGRDQLFYVVETSTGKRVGYEASQIIHLAGHGWDGCRGYSALKVMADSVGYGLATRKFGSTFFKNNARPGLVIEHPQRLTADQVDILRSQWTKNHASVENAHKVAILSDGMKAHQISVNAKDAQLLDSQRFNLLDIANFFGVPPHKLGHDARTSYNSLSEENQSYLDEALDPWLCLIESELFEKLLPERLKLSEEKVLEFNRGALLRANMKDRGEFYHRALSGAPFMTINEARKKENLLPLIDGDALRLPTNNFGPSDDSPDEDEDEEAAAELAPAEPETNSAALPPLQRKWTAETERLERRIASNIQRKGATWWEANEQKERQAADEILADLRAALVALGQDCPTPAAIVTDIITRGNAA